MTYFSENLVVSTNVSWWWRYLRTDLHWTRPFAQWQVSYFVSPHRRKSANGLNWIREMRMLRKWRVKHLQPCVRIQYVLNKLRHVYSKGFTSAVTTYPVESSYKCVSTSGSMLINVTHVTRCLMWTRCIMIQPSCGMLSWQ